MLTDKHSTPLKKQYPLGDIAGAPNGFSTVLYEKFTPPYPNWLLSLEDTMQHSSKVLLNNTVTDNSPEVDSSWELVLTPSNPEIQRVPPISMLHHNDNSKTLSEAVKYQDSRIAVIGDSAVATALIEQLKLLPVKTQWLLEQQPASQNSPIICQQISDEAIAMLPGKTLVAIATSSHELDIRCCYRALLNERLAYIGCLGSVRKSDIVKNHLRELGISEARLNQLTMPIGLPGITGKQPAIIAASIVAQLLTTHENYFST